MRRYLEIGEPPFDRIALIRILNEDDEARDYFALPGTQVPEGPRAARYAVEGFTRRGPARRGNYCLCGCGERAKVGAKFVAGHNFRLLALARRIRAGLLDLETVPEDMRQRVAAVMRKEEKRVRNLQH